MTVSVYYGKQLGAYGFGEDHPFGVDRQQAFWDEFIERKLDQKTTVQQPVQATEDDLLLFHTAEYVEKVRTLSQRGEGFLDAGDTPAIKGIYEAAACVAGSVIDAAEKILNNETTRAFVPIAGLHHAYRDRASGFCVFNDVGVVIEVLKQRHGLKRIAYVDIDAHHGDGVFYCFENDPAVFFADIHEDGTQLFPGTGFADETGKGAATGKKLNISLNPGATDQDFMLAWSRIEAFISDADPEFILLQCGADSLQGDPITHLALSQASHRHASKQLCRIADQYCHGRLLAMGGGGYNRHNLAMAWNAVIESMLL